MLNKYNHINNVKYYLIKIYLMLNNIYLFI